MRKSLHVTTHIGALCALIATFAGRSHADVSPASQAPTPDASAPVAAYAELAFRTYKSAHGQAQNLQHAVADLTSNPADDADELLSRARQAWLDARSVYGESEVFRFYEGPIDFGKRADGTQGPEGRINAWPLNEAYIDALINDASVPITRAALIERNARDDEADVTTGYHAIEYLLWGPDLNANGPGNRSARDFVGGGAAQRRRDYLRVTADLLVDDLASVVAAWAPATQNYRAQFQALPAKESVAKILTGLATLSGFELGFERLATALDSGSQEDEQSCFSDNTVADVIANVTGIANVYFGQATAAGGSIDALVAKANPVIHERLTEQIARSLALAKALDQPFDQTLATPPGSAQRAKVEALVTSLQTQTRLLKQAGVALGVNLVVAVEYDES